MTLLAASDALTVIEHARRHCVTTLPLQTARDRKVYLFTMETFQQAFWDVVKASPTWPGNRKVMP